MPGRVAAEELVCADSPLPTNTAMTSIRQAIMALLNLMRARVIDGCMCFYLSVGAVCAGMCLQASANYSRVPAIERRALQSEAMGLCLGASCKLNFWSERVRKKRATIRAPMTALKLFVPFDRAQGRFVPHSSDLTSRSTQCHHFSSNREQCRLAAEQIIDR